MVCTSKYTVEPPTKAESGCIYQHAALPLFYYAFENKTHTENGNTCGYNYSYDYGNGYSSTITKNLTSDFSYLGTCIVPINMNARLYDPVLGRFLSPDPYVPDGSYSQDFNRYSYARNNPMIYTDPDGEWIHIVIGAVIGGAVNLTVKAFQGKINSWGDGFAAFGIGAAAGALGAATGGAAFLAAGGGAAGAGGFVAGMAGGMVGSAYSTPLLSMGNSAYFGDPMMTPQQYLTSIAVGGLVGGSVQGISALANGKTFWTGDLKPIPAPLARPTLPTLNSSKSEINTEGLRAKPLEVNPNRTPAFSDPLEPTPIRISQSGELRELQSITPQDIVRMNGGRNTIMIEGEIPGIRYQVDFMGATHKGVPTPHLQRYIMNTNPNTGQIFWNKDNSWVRPISQSELNYFYQNYLLRLFK